METNQEQDGYTIEELQEQFPDVYQEILDTADIQIEDLHALVEEAAVASDVITIGTDFVIYIKPTDASVFGQFNTDDIRSAGISLPADGWIERKPDGQTMLCDHHAQAWTVSDEVLGYFTNIESRLVDLAEDGVEYLLSEEYVVEGLQGVRFDQFGEIVEDDRWRAPRDYEPML